MAHNTLSNVQEKIHDLAFLGKCNPKIRRYVLLNSDKKLIKAIRECIHKIKEISRSVNTK